MATLESSDQSKAPPLPPGREASGGPRIEQQHVGDVVVTADQIEIGARADADRLDHLDAEAGADRRHALRRLAAMHCKKAGSTAAIAAASEASSASTVKRTFAAPAGTRAPAPPDRARHGAGLSKKTKPTMSAPALTAASTASCVLRPQILTIMSGFLHAYMRK